MIERSVYDVWGEYDNFIRSLHLSSFEDDKKKSKRKILINYVKKLIVIFFASFFTTLTFYIFMSPNGLFNSGINGLIQVLLDYYFLKNCISREKFAIQYYTSVLFLNIFIILITYPFFPKSLEMNSTAVFYVIFQIIWTKIFKLYSLDNFIFSRFAPKAWKNLSSVNQLGLTLPFYITIAMISSLIHTYGYSLIYRVKSTPGGLEIITSNLSQNNKSKNKKSSIGYITKIFGFLIVFLITLFNFVFVEDNIELKNNEIIVEINNVIEEEKKIKNKEDLDKFIKNWSKIENKNEKISKILRKISRDDNLTDHPEEILYYTRDKHYLLNKLKEKKRELKKKNSNLSKKSIKRIRKRIRELEINTYDSGILGYFKYITNNEMVWSSLIYIIFSSYLINQIYPKSKSVYLIAKVKDKENLDKIMKMLEDYNPSYFISYSSNKEIYVVNCLIAKWDYQLRIDKLSKLGKFLIINESN